MNCFKSTLNVGSLRARFNSCINSFQLIFDFNFLLLKSYFIQHHNQNRYKKLAQKNSDAAASIGAMSKFAKADYWKVNNDWCDSMEKAQKRRQEAQGQSETAAGVTTTGK